jgi:two-component system, cell cycle response regulator
VDGHPLVGERIIAQAPALRQVAEIVRCSHERIDGSGYPSRLTGSAIPIGARIIAVCDTYCELLAGGPGRPPVDHEAAAAAVRDAAGRTLDDQAVALLVQCLEHSHPSL